MANFDSDLDSISHNNLIAEVLKLRKAIRNHRDQKGDDRCWMDDIELYKTLPEGVADADLSLLSDDQFKRNCDLFVKNRKRPVPKGAVIGQYVMDRLKESCSKNVVIFGVTVVGNFVYTGNIFEVNDYKSFEFSRGTGMGIEDMDFIKSGVAIKKILDGKGNVLYENTVISWEYGSKHKTKDEIYELQVLSFGKEVAEKLCENKK